MITVPVHKDVLAYEPKVLAFLTSRTLAFTAIAVALGLAVGLVLIGALGISSDVAMYPIMAVTMPVWYFGFARPHKMKPEVLAPLWLRHKFLPQKLTYVSSAVLKGEVPPTAVPRETLTERYPDHVRSITKEYAHARAQRGAECL